MVWYKEHTRVPRKICSIPHMELAPDLVFISRLMIYDCQWRFMCQVRKLRPGALPDGSSVNRKIGDSVDGRQVGTGLNWCPNLHHVSNKQKCLIGHMVTRSGNFQVRFVLGQKESG
jgi:hypothetical protein